MYCIVVDHSFAGVTAAGSDDHHDLIALCIRVDVSQGVWQVFSTPCCAQSMFHLAYSLGMQAEYASQPGMGERNVGCCVISAYNPTLYPV